MTQKLPAEGKGRKQVEFMDRCAEQYLLLAAIFKDGTVSVLEY